MKFTTPSLTAFSALLLLGMSPIGACAQENTDKAKKEEISIVITKEVDGETKTFKRTYSSVEEMHQDEELRAFDPQMPPFPPHPPRGRHIMVFGDGEEWEEELELEIEEAMQMRHKAMREMKRIHSDSLREGHAMWYAWDDEENPRVMMFKADSMHKIARDMHRKHKVMVQRMMEEDDSMMIIDRDVWVERHRRGDFEESSIALSDLEDKDRTKAIKALETKNELKLDNFSFFANRPNGRVVLAFDAAEKKPLKVSLFDSQGQELYSEYYPIFEGKYRNQINLQNREKGTYFLRIEQDGKATLKKLELE
ncbi:T9SS type A sorting domain-containing protein [Cytophagales bacterium LB-30]|uniref:T9SS type A sorting domain-containing protein n=1 Tax=Shiella aurantiaca TaxID=3058365 RepID=A0ABT8F250_9BACT|nr:T9SS type A sorting domain-containing protein [Shiella aurantiaca]MDN4164515.1 T9SS type A sorting domain-containing protein [Shiella aurantiaca]